MIVNSESYFVSSEKTLRMQKDFKGGNVIKMLPRSSHFINLKLEKRPVQNRFQR